MLIDMLIFRLALRQRSGDQPALFQARPRDFVRIGQPADGALPPNPAPGASRA